MVFVAFALVGSNFSPPEDEEATGAAGPKEGRTIQHLVNIVFFIFAWNSEADLFYRTSGFSLSRYVSAVDFSLSST